MFADPVTYDDEGNVIPLSQRFNAENDDIRYSKKNVDNIGEKQYNYFTESKEFYKLFPSEASRSTFRRSLANKTNGMQDGETKIIYVVGYVFEATGYLKGRIITRMTAKNRNKWEAIIDADKRINQDREIAAIWSESIRNVTGRPSDNSDILGRGGRPSVDDKLFGEQLGGSITRDNERVWQTFETKEEVERVVRELKQMLGLDDTKHSRKTVDPITSREELAKALSNVAKGEDRAIVESYKANINLIKGETERLNNLRKEIDEIKYKKSITYEGRELSVKEFEQIAYRRAEERLGSL